MNKGFGFLGFCVLAGALLIAILSLIVNRSTNHELQRLYALNERQDAILENMRQSVMITTEDIDHSGKKISSRVDVLFSEVDKLWASAWRRNKADIATLKKDLQSHADQWQSEKNNIHKHIEVLSNVVNSTYFLTVIERMENLDATIVRLDDTVLKTESRLKQNEELVDGINEWRRDYNQRLLEIVKSLQDIKQTDNTEKPVFKEIPL